MSHGNRREMSRTALAIAEVCRPTDHRCAICLGPVSPGCDVCGDPECCAEALKMDAALWAPESSRADAANEEA